MDKYNYRFWFNARHIDFIDDDFEGQIGVLPEQKRMTILRKGKLGQYKRLQVGDIYIGKCWLCESRCLCEELANGCTKHFIDTGLMRIFDG